MTETARFEGTIGPANLLGLVRNTAPFLLEPPLRERPAGERLLEMGAGPLGWLDILHHAERLEATARPTVEQREDYFALCLACHHATVATFIPTDVDSKIRGLAWQHSDRESLRRMFELVLQARHWDVSRITARAVLISDAGPISGHNGELLSVLNGALGAFVRTGDAEGAENAAAAIDEELRREADELRRAMRGKGLELELLKLAAVLTHNVGDVDQGQSFWKKSEPYQPYRERFGRLAHENTAPYGGAYRIAAHLYKHTLAPEGHRNYPLREVRGIRTSAEFLLPMAPFLDAWGETIGGHAGLRDEDRAEVLGALLHGCRTIPGQLGYYRAIAGMARTLGSRLEKVGQLMPAALRRELKDAEVRRHQGIKPISFESGYRKKALALLAGAR